MFASLLLALGLLSAVSDAQQTPQQEYIHKYASIAQAEMRRTGVPASITLAQGLLESGAGLSTLAVKSNNHFGIKCHKNWKGKKVYHDDDAKGECFRSYSKPEESFRDHSDFLRYNDRYKFLFDYDISDYRSWCYGLKQAGYATDPKYATKLIDLIETYGLGRYDVGKVEVEAPDKIEAPVKSAIQYDEEFRFKVERTVYEKNGVRFVYARRGDTYASIASLYDLFPSEILRFNDLAKTEDLKPGDIVYLSRKKSRTAKGLDMYIVQEEGESLWAICQRFAVRKASVMKRNSITDGTVLAEGQEIRLR